MQKLRHSAWLFWGGMFVAILFVCYLALSLSGLADSSATALAAQGSLAPMPASTNHPSLGLPAISPRVGAFSASQAAFTHDDVIHYVSTHPIPQTRVVSGSLTVNSVSFLMSQQVSDLLKGESTGVADNTLLCLVEFQGNVAFLNGPPGTTQPLSFSHVYEVFDAHTGNLLMQGGLPEM